MTWDLLLGDCLEIMPTLEAGSFHAIVADPPYGIGGQIVRRGGEDLEDAPEWDVADHRWIPIAARLLAPDSHLLAFCDHRDIGTLWTAFRDAGIRPRSCLLWIKTQSPPNPRRTFQSAWEVAVWGTKGRYAWRGGGCTPNVYQGPSVKTWRIHETQKPEPLMRWILRTLTVPGQRVLDPFAGSATTGVACLEEGLDFVGIEREPGDYQRARRRMDRAARDLRLGFGPPPDVACNLHPPPRPDAHARGSPLS